MKGFTLSEHATNKKLAIYNNQFKILSSFRIFVKPLRPLTWLPRRVQFLSEIMQLASCVAVFVGQSSKLFRAKSK